MYELYFNLNPHFQSTFIVVNTTTKRWSFRYANELPTSSRASFGFSVNDIDFIVSPRIAIFSNTKELYTNFPELFI